MFCCARASCRPSEKHKGGSLSIVSTHLLRVDFGRTGVQAMQINNRLLVLPRIASVSLSLKRQSTQSNPWNHCNIHRVSQQVLVMHVDSIVSLQYDNLIIRDVISPIAPLSYFHSNPQLCLFGNNATPSQGSY